MNKNNNTSTYSLFPPSWSYHWVWYLLLLSLSLNITFKIWRAVFQKV